MISVLTHLKGSFLCDLSLKVPVPGVLPHEVEVSPRNIEVNRTLHTETRYPSYHART